MPTNGPFRVAIGEFANLISLGLSLILDCDPCLEIVGTDLDYEALLDVLGRKSAPEVVVLDEEAAISAVIAGLRGRSPDLGIVVIVHGSTPASRLLRARLQARPGSSCLSTDSSSSELRTAVQSAAEFRD